MVNQVIFMHFLKKPISCQIKAMDEISCVICVEIEPVAFGFESQKILMVVPIDYSNQGNSDFVNYSPANYLRKMSPGFHRQISIRIENGEKELISFDFGKITFDIEILKNV